MWDLVNDILILFPIIFNIAIGIFILAKGFKRANIIFFLITLLFSLWSVSLYFFKYPIFYSDLVFIRISYSLISTLIVFIALFTFIYPVEVKLRKKKIVKIYSFFYLLYSLYYFWEPNEMIVTKGDKAVGFGSLYLIWIIMTFGMFLLVFWDYFLIKSNLSLVDKLKKRYLFYAFGFWSIIVCIFSIIVPLNYGFEVNFSLMAAPSLIFSSIVSYAILNKRLMDLKLLGTKVITYVFLTFFVVLFYTGILKIFDKLIFPASLSENEFVLSIILVVTTAYILPISKKYLEKVSYKLFYKRNFESGKFLTDISKILVSEIELGKVLKKSLIKIIEKHEILYGAVYLFEEKKLKLKMKQGEEDINFDEKFVNKVSFKKKEIILFDEINGKKIKKYFEKNKIGGVIKLKTNKDDLGFLVLGKKKNEEIFSDEEIKILRILSSQLSVAIQNSLNYEEIQAFSDKLQNRVKKATGKLRFLNKRLKELDKLKDEFVSVAAHELRAPLTAVKGYLSMISEGDAGKVSKKLNKFLDGALEGTEREVRLVNNMLNVSRIEEGRLTYKIGKIHLKEVVKDVFEEYKIEAKEKQLKYSLETDKNIKDLVKVDEDRIHEVVANLINNAVKYTDKGFVKVKLFNKDGKIRFEVCDSGFGIDKKDQRKLFKKFYRTASSGGKSIGTGLGLYIVKLLIDKFGGNLGVESEAGKGSIFWFELPCK